MPSKPTFLQSITSGAKGYFKGMLAGGAFGIVAGAAFGAILGALLPTVTILAGAAAGAYVLGSSLGFIGSIAGMATHVVRTQQAGYMTTEDAVNLAKVSVAQGIGIGRQQAQEEALAQSGTKWQDQHHRREADKALAMNEHTVH